MTVKCSLEQTHHSFQEDVAIDGNIFFKGWSVKTGGEEMRHCSSRCKYQFVMERKWYLGKKGASVHNVGANPSPLHCLGQTIPLLYLCIFNVKWRCQCFFTLFTSSLGLITCVLCFEYEMCIIRLNGIIKVISNE